MRQPLLESRLSGNEFILDGINDKADDINYRRRKQAGNWETRESRGFLRVCSGIPLSPFTHHRRNLRYDQDIARRQRWRSQVEGGKDGNGFDIDREGRNRVKTSKQEPQDRGRPDTKERKRHTGGGRYRYKMRKHRKEEAGRKEAEKQETG